MKDFRKGDHLYFQHKAGPRAGRVLCRGKHGVTLETDDGQRHQVYWKHVLGHKERVTPAYRVVDQGADGAIVEEQDGKQVFIQGLQETEERKVKNDKPVSAWDRLGKSMGELSARVLFFKGAIANRPGLRLEDVTDKTGRHTKRWKRGAGDDEGQGRKPAGSERGKHGSKQGYGTHHLEPGDAVSFRAGNVNGQGKIVAAGKDGATVKDDAGQEHKVLWSEITDHKPAGGSKPHDAQQEVHGPQKPMPPDVFVAAKYFEQHNNPAITPEEILKSFPPDTKEKMEAARQRLESIEQTIDQHKQDGEYTAERQKVHEHIYAHFLSEERVKAATPEDGGEPTFMMLGGRGGSGKSWFKGKVYDPEKFIVLDADEIKGMLPEYEGWNAHQVHEESSEILDRILAVARANGLNVVLDATMKTAKSALQKVRTFKEAGYRVEAHYMHLPRQEAAKRAVRRFLGKSQRLVPVGIVLENTSNEATFDEVRKHCDAWSFRDNNVPEGLEPKLISELKEALKKALRYVILFIGGSRHGQPKRA